MARRYAEADLIICRAGASTIAELAAAGVASVLVPYPHAVDDHQTANARFLAGRGAALLIPQREFSAQRLSEVLAGYTRERLLAMAQRGARGGKAGGDTRGRGNLHGTGESSDEHLTLTPSAQVTRMHPSPVNGMRHRVKQVHFVGIGGAGMSGIAEVLLTLRYKVSGSDLAENTATRRLRQLGAKIHLGHAEGHIAGADAVVVSTAVAVENPEVAAARAKKIPVVPRALMLAELMRLKQGIAVAGTHGKTTTTSLCASVLAEGGLDPTFVIGGRLEAAGSNARLGAGEFIVVEADESDASFLYLQPVLAVVTNIDADHMETYDHSLDKLRQAFVDFLQRLPFYGVAVLCADDSNVRVIMPQLTKPITTYGLAPDAHVRAHDVTASGGQMRFRVARAGEGGASGAEMAITLNLPGVHNVRNALAAIAVGLELGVPEAKIVKALAEFQGVGRRFQNYGKVRLPGGGSCTLIDDYGHHPVEMAATLAAARGAFPSAASCWHFSRTATRAPATASRISCRCSRPRMRWCSRRSTRRARRRSSRRTGARSRARCACRARSSRCSWKRWRTWAPRSSRPRATGTWCSRWARVR